MLVVIGEAGETVSEPAPAAPAVATAPEPALAMAGNGEAAPAAAPTLTTARPPAMPLVRRLAKQHGIDLSAVAGTGVAGRITRKDVEAAVAAAAPASAPAVPAAPAGERTAERVKLSKLRRSIGAHMTGQWQAVPHISAHVDADASRLLAARKGLGERLGKKIPMDAFFAALVIPALEQFPVANATIEGDEIVLRKYYDIGIAVGSPEGLLVPIVRDVDRLSFAELVDRVEDLTARAKERKVAPDEMGDQTFTISNLGGLRGQHATQVIPAGTTGIISLGRAREQAVVRDGAIVAAPVMAISGTFDHRAMDGVEAMGVLNAVVDVIEEPTLLLI
jgi:pyruvate/2-oxoglutarate dehydrogenase complex dihydrolipoamide acyltransferase (E2) component